MYHPFLVPHVVHISPEICFFPYIINSERSRSTMGSEHVVNIPNDSLYHHNLITALMFSKMVLKNVDM